MTNPIPSDRWRPLHPLDPIAPRPARESLARLLCHHREPIIVAWRRKAAGSLAIVEPAQRADIFTYGFNACLEFLSKGSLPRPVKLMERFGNPGEAPADTATRLHHVLNVMGVVVLPIIYEAYAGEPEKEQQAMALLLGAMSLGSARVCRALERAVTARSRQTESRHLRFLEELTRVVSHDSLRLVSPERVPTVHGVPLPIKEPRDGSRLRHAVARLANEVGMERARIEDLGLAVGEAVSNILKHAGEGLAHVWRDDRTVFVHLADSGNGIAVENIPKALTLGWSSEVSLGMGFTLMLEMSDTLWLATGPRGTSICIEKSTTPRPRAAMNGNFPGTTILAAR